MRTTSYISKQCESRFIHHVNPVFLWYSQSYSGLPQSCPSAENASGGHPATAFGVQSSLNWNSSCSAHASDESKATYIGISPIIFIPLSFAYFFKSFHSSTNSY